MKVAASRRELRALFGQDPDPVRKLRALWSLYVIGGADGGFLRTLSVFGIHLIDQFIIAIAPVRSEWRLVSRTGK